MISDYRDLEVWRLSMEACREVYRLVKLLPVDERYALGDQLRRAVVSIPSNIAEGNGRASAKDYAHFLSIARGSSQEVRTQIELAIMLGFLPPQPELDALLVRISKMLYAIMRKLSSK